MPFVDIKIAGQLSKEKKEAIAKEITDTLKRHAGKPPEYTYVVFEEVSRENWAIAGELLG